MEREIIRGLTEEEARRRLKEFGPNALPAPRHTFLRLVARQYKGVFNLLLLAAAGLTFALGEPVDASFILFFVFLGTGLNIYQEHKANAAADKLKSYLQSTITVIRDGRRQEVLTSALVPGDVMSLESGDIVPADALILQEWSLQADETTFTGESIPVGKQAGLGRESPRERNTGCIRGSLSSAAMPWPR